MNQAIREPIEHTTGETMPAATHRRRTWLLGGSPAPSRSPPCWPGGGAADASWRAPTMPAYAPTGWRSARRSPATSPRCWWPTTPTSRPATCCAWTRATSASACAPPRPAKRRRRRWKPSARSWRPSIGNCWSRRRRSAAPAPMAKRREPNGAAPRPTGDATGNWPTSMPPVASAWRMPTRRTSERGRQRGGQAPRKAASAPPGTY